ncbi:MAG: methyltransferase domain-containing protein [Sedimentisphaerales bacterium]|nr:methyltransferase domain-containing protein [Sedimentisphaerales bacterium]
MSSSASYSNYLNLGCGHRFHPAWTNVDFVSTGKDVMAVDLAKGIPFPDASFNVVYHSHLLEHFSRSEAEPFLRECCRLLRPNGILRVAVPDLEQIVKAYLVALEKAGAGSEEWEDNYEWILLEMYDQTVRDRPGGEMAAYLSRDCIPNEEFVFRRCGMEAKNIINRAWHRRQQADNLSKQKYHPKRLLGRICRLLCRWETWRELLLKVVCASEYEALQIGRFRRKGEVHRWMYDRYSLSVLLGRCGLKSIKQQTATESYVPDWASFNLDTNPDGTIYKPDSLYIEGIKL